MDDSMPDVTGEDDESTVHEGQLLPVGLDSLQVGGAAPEEGDTVSFQVEGTVERIEGDKAYVKPEKTNGEDISDEDEGEGEEADDDDKMRSMAEALDQGGGYST